MDIIDTSGKIVIKWIVPKIQNITKGGNIMKLVQEESVKHLQKLCFDDGSGAINK